MKFRHICLLLTAILLTSCGKKSTMWEGTWQSTQYPSVMGTLKIELPSSLKRNQSLQTPIAISYSPESIYRGGDSINVEFEVNVNSGGTSDGIGLNDDVVVSFKSIIQGEQTITYTAPYNKKLDQISGHYISKMPGDKGTFTIQKEN